MDSRVALGIGVGLGAGATLLLVWLRDRQKLQDSRYSEHSMLVDESRDQRRHAIHTDIVDAEDSDEMEDPSLLRSATLSRESSSGPVSPASAAKSQAGRRSPRSPRKVKPKYWQEKEDALIRFLFYLMRHRYMSLQRACAYAERLIDDFLAGKPTELGRLAPDLVSLGSRHSSARRLHTRLPLKEAYERYDAATRLSVRQRVPPQFREVRNIVNLAQALASAKEGVRLITFDGDGTLYPDRGVLDDAGEGEAAQGAAELLDALVALLDRGVTVALCTAVGSPSPEPYNERLRGLLRRLQQKPATAARAPVYAVGGQCNFAFRYSAQKEGFVALKREDWEPPAMWSWTHETITAVLDAAEAALKKSAADLGMIEDTKLIRKERAVGLLYLREVHRSTPFFLDELALQARQAVMTALEERDKSIPFCTFNGGRDVFVDVGTKEIGIDALRGLTGAERSQTLHLGDQFTRTGNDLLARRACGTIWVDSPQETTVVLNSLLQAIDAEAAAAETVEQ